MHSPKTIEKLLLVTFLPLIIAGSLIFSILMQNNIIEVRSNSYAFIILPIALVGIGFAICKAYQFENKSFITLPSSLFLIVFAYFVGIGSLSQYLEVIAGHPLTFSEFLVSAYEICSIGLVCWIVGYIIAGLWSSWKPSGERLIIWDKKRLKLVSLLWAIVGILFMILYFNAIGYVPLLNGKVADIDPTLRAMADLKGHTLSVIGFNATTMGMLFTGLYLILFGSDAIVAIAFILTVISFLGWGARVYIVYPGLILGLIYLHKHKTGIARYFLIALPGYIGFVAFAWWRNRSINQFTFNSILGLLAYLRISPEFTEFLNVLLYRPLLSTYYTSANFFNAILLTMLPDFVWNIVLPVVSKNSVFTNSSAWIIANIARSSNLTGIRAGLIAELMMAFGVDGVIIAFLVLGMLFRYLDERLRFLNPASPKMLLIYMFTILFSLSIVSQNEITFSRFWYGLYGTVITLIFASRFIKYAKDQKG